MEMTACTKCGKRTVWIDDDIGWAHITEYRPAGRTEYRPAGRGGWYKCFAVGDSWPGDMSAMVLQVNVWK